MSVKHTDYDWGLNKANSIMYSVALGDLTKLFLAKKVLESVSHFYVYFDSTENMSKQKQNH